MKNEIQGSFNGMDPTIEDLWVKEKTEAPVIVLSSEQAQLIFRGNGKGDNKGVPIAKPWDTTYRGELFIYIPDKKITVPLELYPYEFKEYPIGKGIVGIASLKSTLQIHNEEEWQETFSGHKEKGSKPFEKTYLWYLQERALFHSPFSIKIAGRWLDLEDSDHEKEDAALRDPGKHIRPPEKRELHRISLFHFLYTYRG